jgi:carbonic anhydrase/acetyltransferase-like protein (isoleucine patch superfamily)
VIEDDVWIGTRAIILHGVTVHRGAVVGAGAVVGRSVPPYAVVCGVPARVVRFRWDVDTILVHEAALYPPNARLTREALERTRAIQTSPAVREACCAGGAATS